MDAFSCNTLLICFGGGIVGAALGGLLSFLICALSVLLGCMMVMMGGTDFLLLQVGLGPIFGPHVGGFAAGVAAATYAAGVRKNHPTGAAKDILSPLIGTSWDVLLIGGAFSLFGHLFVTMFGTLPIIKDFDVLGLTVVVSALLARLLFQKQMPWGNPESIRQHGYLGTNNYALSWIPWALPLSKLTVFGFGAGLLSGALAAGATSVMAPAVAQGTISSANATVVPLILGWSVAGVSLIGLQLGTASVQRMPAWHCQAVLAGLSYVLFGSILVAGIVGVVATLLQELMARMFWNHGDNHIDPPATAITLGTFVLVYINRFIH
jgi:hypothetical protein